ncbi:MAG TPA: HAMP domain-containing histidine kinase [Nitrospiraceae bacterium]|nr:HAMP domain-containing histidine kinase [Nitrospiraceae bacterium]
MQTLKRLLRQFRALKLSLSLKFIIGVAIVLAVTTGTSIHYINENHKKLVVEQIDQQARALFRQIVLTRKWISDHGGVFVERMPWKEPSPYLSDPEIIDTHGKKYVRQSPAMVTKELSKYAREKGLYWFHITSLKLINPENAPDEFERAALKEFETKGTRESTKIEKVNSSYFYRYIAPLYIEETCLKCHSHQGYRPGDVRGAISVTVPMDSALVMINSGRRDLIITSSVTIGILMIVLFIMMKELVIRPVNELKSSIEDFSKGRKSRTAPVSTGDELEDLSNSFVDMSRALSDYHKDLEDKVQKATSGLEEANMKLVELNEKKSDFIAKISHELRTPMTSIKGAMDYISVKLARDSRDAGELTEFLDVIKNNADRLIRLVNDTLDLERIESGMFDLHYSEVDLLSLIKDVAISFQSLAGDKNITFRITATPGILVDADEDRIRQVLINLVSNALKYGPDNSEIQMSVTANKDSVTVYIKDEGPGIPDDIQGKIFDKFYTIGKRHGTGLGLAICKGIIESHKGEINVLSNEGDGNNTFYFRLPRRVTA